MRIILLFDGAEDMVNTLADKVIEEVKNEVVRNRRILRKARNICRIMVYEHD